MAQATCPTGENGTIICEVLTGVGVGTGNVLDALTFPIIVLIAVIGIVGALVLFIGSILKKAGRFK